MHTFVEADWKRNAFLLLFYAVAWYGSALIQAQAGSQNQSFWWVPIFFMGTLVITTDWKAHAAQGMNS
jgi:hypothetical protein